MPWDTSLDTRAELDYRRSHRLSSREGSVITNWQTSGIDTTVAAVAGRIYAVPIYLPDTIHVSRIISEVTTGTAGNMRMSLYTDSGGYPNALVKVETEITTTATAGIKVQDISLTLPNGFYWGATHFDATPTMRADNIGDGAMWLGFSTAVDTVTHPGIIVTDAYGALPDPFTAGGTLVTTAIPRVLLTTGKYGNLP